MTDRRKFLIFENSYELTNFLIESWRKLLKKSLKEHGSFHVALTGGKTCIEFYSKLACLQDFHYWKNTHIYFTDERFVSPESPDSNYRLIRENLLMSVPIPPENVHFIRTDFENASLAARDYEQRLKRNLRLKNELPCLDLIVLSLGSGGHIASLFNKPKVSDEQNLVVSVFPKEVDFERISLSFSLINNAECIYMPVIGSKKKELLSQEMQNHPDFPASYILPKNGEMVFFLDRDAALFLKEYMLIHNEDQTVSIKSGSKQGEKK